MNLRLEKAGGYLSIEWSVSSYAGSDALSAIITNEDTGVSESLKKISGTEYGTNYSSLKYTKYNSELEEGKYTVSIKYVKDAGNNYGLDRGYVKNGTILKYDSTGEDTVTIHQYGGLVIYEGAGEITDSNAWNESKNRNQFVWVPVADTSRIYENNATTGQRVSNLWQITATGRQKLNSRAEYKDRKKEVGVLERNDAIRNLHQNNMQGYTEDFFYKELEDEYKKTMLSIERYGGFYIGRYETGDVLSEMPVVKRLNNSLNSDAWHILYANMRNISKNENIQINMIWGCLWDEVLEWLIETGEKTRADVGIDSSDWGNYLNVSFTYINVNGVIKDKSRGSGESIPTGSTERNKANNIYDLAGNKVEWTLEKHDAARPDNWRTARGGSAIYGGYYGMTGGYVPAEGRSSYVPGRTYGRTGTRAFFYIK